MEQINENLSDRQTAAITFLLSEPTITAAADKAGVGRTTLYTWLKDPSFAGAYRAARRDALQHATARLQSEAEASVRVLAEIRDATATPASTRLQAAVKVLELAYRTELYEDLEAMLEELQNDE